MTECHVGVLGATGAGEAVRGETVTGGFEYPDRQEVDPDEDEDPGKPDPKAVFPGHEQTQSLRGGYGAAGTTPQPFRGPPTMIRLVPYSAFWGMILRPIRAYDPFGPSGVAPSAESSPSSPASSAASSAACSPFGSPELSLPAGAPSVSDSGSNTGRSKPDRSSNSPIRESDHPCRRKRPNRAVIEPPSGQPS